VETSTGTASEITISNDRGALTTEDVERMVQEAAAFSEQVPTTTCGAKDAVVVC
jgi:hypothetical protein